MDSNHEVSDNGRTWDMKLFLRGACGTRTRCRAVSSGCGSLPDAPM